MVSSARSFQEFADDASNNALHVLGGFITTLGSGGFSEASAETTEGAAALGEAGSDSSAAGGLDVGGGRAQALVQFGSCLVEAGDVFEVFDVSAGALLTPQSALLSGSSDGDSENFFGVALRATGVGVV